jgi:hypothetical protein
VTYERRKSRDLMRTGWAPALSVDPAAAIGGPKRHRFVKGRPALKKKGHGIEQTREVVARNDVPEASGARCFCEVPASRPNSGRPRNSRIVCVGGSNIRNGTVAEL